MAYTVYSFQIRYINFKFNLTIKLITEVPKGMNEQLLNSLWGRYSSLPLFNASVIRH